jgi:N-acetylmuramoyl-L-alanine amidase
MRFGLWRRAFARIVVAGGVLSCASLTSDPVAAQQMAAAQPAQAVGVTGVAAATGHMVAGDLSRTRFIIGLERHVEFQVFSLSNPNRVIVELPDVKLQLPQFSGHSAVGLVQSFRGGLSAPGKARVVIDVTKPVVVEKASIDRGRDGRSPRLLLEIVPVDAGSKSAAARKPVMTVAGAAGLGASGVQPPLPKPVLRRPSKDVDVYKPTIVIDPGHGGHDSGAQKYGTVEKAVVLAFSLKLREKLLATGRYKVLMTRDTDRFVELDERRDYADRNKAALFIAVHADYAGSQARGATVYSLRDSTMRELQRSANREVANVDNVLTSNQRMDVKRADGDVNAVASILSDLAQREVAATAERTKVFTGSVVEFMGSSTNMMSNPDREANFRVLKSAKMPSVLIELAYVTNKVDADNLKSDVWRDKVATSILRAVENYFSNQMARLPL